MLISLRKTPGICYWLRCYLDRWYVNWNYDLVRHTFDIFNSGSAGQAVGYHSAPSANAGNDARIVFLEKVSIPYHLINLYECKYCPAFRETPHDD